MDIFVDSDVVISSLISQKGAAYSLIHYHSVNRFISDISILEMNVVVKELHINKQSFKETIHNYFKIIHLKTSIKEINKIYKTYVYDIDDTHIVAGAKEANVRFLITYNLRDYKINKIKRDLDIIVLTPGMFLQYLRSI